MMKQAETNGKIIKMKSIGALQKVPFFALQSEIKNYTLPRELYKFCIQSLLELRLSNAKKALYIKHAHQTTNFVLFQPGQRVFHTRANAEA